MKVKNELTSLKKKSALSFDSRKRKKEKLSYILIETIRAGDYASDLGRI